MNDFINLKHLEDDIRVHYNKKDGYFRTKSPE